MADKMTLEQVRADIRDCNKKHLLPSLSDLRNWADAIGAHLAAMGEPVGCVTISHFRDSPNMENHDFDYYGSLPDGTHTLFAATQPGEPQP